MNNVTDPQIRYSIVIPAYNEASNIKRLVTSINRAKGQRSDVEITLVDNQSTDNTRAIAVEMGLDVVDAQRVKISALRNMGGMNAKGEIILFLDADMEVPENWFQLIEEYFDKKNVDALGFVEKIPEEAGWFARVWSQRTAARRDNAMKVDFLPGRNICVRKAYFDKVQGFDTELTTGEDKDFVLRLSDAGAQVWSIPNENMYHWGYERSLAELLRKEFWRQSSHVDLLRKQGLSLRLLRFPVISVLHWLLAVWFLLCVLQGNVSQAAGVAVVWFLPALVMTLAKPLSRTNVTAIMQFSFLYWLRFHVAGLSVLRSLYLLQKNRAKQESTS
ncbi:glycosyltransferase [Alkalimarinus coralli]|uniref:glycosyltransferase n=1 Tax=Alkalimarinus coralli TaxID=2935863 RepID=UPI00202ACDBD|nr:glycosyltransferase [Alkalimarinus coralli]